MKRGHLERRPTRGRTVAWSRIPDVRDGYLVGVQYRLFVRLSTTGATVSEIRTFDLALLSTASIGARAVIAAQLRGMRAQLKWRRDQLDFQHLGLQDTAPPPAVTA